MATFIWLNEISGQNSIPRLVNMDHVRATHPFPGPPPYVMLAMTDGKSIPVRESQEQIAVLLGWYGTQPPKASG